MKLSSNTITVLQNFAKINPGMMFFSGTKQRTSAPANAIYAETVIEENLPQDFGIFDMPQFLNIYNMFNDPDIEFGDRSLVIREGSNQVNYNYSDPVVIKHIPKDKNFVDFGNITEDFVVDSSLFQKVLKTANALRATHIGIVGDGETITLETVDIDTKNANKLSFAVSKTENKFKVILDIKNIKILEADYRFQISVNKIVRVFTTSGPSVTYILRPHKDSTF